MALTKLQAIGFGSEHGLLKLRAATAESPALARDFERRMDTIRAALAANGWAIVNGHVQRIGSKAAAREQAAEDRRATACPYCGKPTRPGSLLIDGQPTHKRCHDRDVKGLEL